MARRQNMNKPLPRRDFLRQTAKAAALAGVVLFDPERVADRATWEEPHQYPVGIYYVIINGQVVIKGGEHTGRLPGRVLKKIA
jgi:N-acyl-D-amino-acid deacylase